MSSWPPSGPPLAEVVADRIRADAPWEVFADEAERYELHLRGTEIELVRGPISVGGYGVRVLKARGAAIGTGFQASTDTSANGVRAVLAEASAIADRTEFPAKAVSLPSQISSGSADLRVSDRTIAADPATAVNDYLAALRQAFDGRTGVELSFGSIRATRVRSSIVNSSGLRASYPHTRFAIEFAVKASGGPEGAAPGEYWIDEGRRSPEVAALPEAVERWCQYAADVRRAQLPPGGELPVVLPPSVAEGILPAVLGFRWSGSARLRGMAPEVGAELASERITVVNDGLVPGALGSGPFDGEGSASRSTPLVDHGIVRGLVYDELHAAAFNESSNAGAVRAGIEPREWLRFRHAPSPGPATLSITPGDGGTVEELCEAARDGIWVQQLGWANPEAVSGVFGGELRIGYRIRGGKLAEPLRGGVIGGAVVAPPGSPSLLTRVAALGSNPELCESLRVPPLLVNPLTVAGAA